MIKRNDTKYEHWDRREVTKDIAAIFHLHLEVMEASDTIDIRNGD